MMKKVLLYCVVSIMLFGYVLPTYSESPGDFPYSPSKYGVPETIGGYATLAVIPATSIPCALEGHLRLILKSESSDVKTFLNQSNGASFQEELQQLDITKSVVWDVSVVSPNTTESDIVFSVNELNRTHNGLCDKLGRIEIDTNSASKPIEVGVNNQEYKVGYSVNGYVVFENLDAASIPNDNAQAVTMNPPLPSIGSNQTADSYLLNNVLTNTGYFLQNGLEFKSNATGGVVYTSDAYGLAAQHYVSSIIYNSTHLYWFTISYTNSYWWMCVSDRNPPAPANYVCMKEPNATGTTVGSNINSAIFFENFNTNANWGTGFGSFGAYNAELYLNGFGQWWSSQHVHTVDNCLTNYLAIPAINSGGTLVGGYGFTLIPSNIPLHC